MADIPFAKKSLGQHWLSDPASLEAMCDAAEITQSDTILEIGPGYGTLTAFLLQRAAFVVSVEFDAKLAAMLPVAMHSDKLEVIRDDILHFDFTTMEPDYKIVANIPYYLTSNLIRTMSETPNAPTVAVLLMQKEVAERVAAAPGSMSLLSVTAQFYWQAELGELVPAYLFTPPPKVDSQILILKRRDTPLFTNIDVPTFFRLVKAGFSQRRKTLLNALSSGLVLPKPEVLSMLEAAALLPGARAQTLSLDDWYRLFSVARAFLP